MRNEFLIASHQILAVGFGELKWYCGDLVTRIVAGHYSLAKFQISVPKVPYDETYVVDAPILPTPR